MTMHEPPRVLVVDDDRGTPRTTVLILDREGYGVETAGSRGDVLGLVEEIAERE